MGDRLIVSQVIIHGVWVIQYSLECLPSSAKRRAAFQTISATRGIRKSHRGQGSVKGLARMRVETLKPVCLIAF